MHPRSIHILMAMLDQALASLPPEPRREIVIADRPYAEIPITKMQDEPPLTHDRMGRQSKGERKRNRKDRWR